MVCIRNSADGFDIVDNYTASDGGGLVKVANGTAGQAPQPGDVMEFRSGDHTGVVTSSSVDGAGNGSITIIEENASASGWGTYAVRGWSVAGATEWLDKPGGSGGGGGTPPPPATAGPTSTSYTGATAGSYNHPVALSADLVDDLTSGGLAGRAVSFTLGSQSCTASTDASGAASCSITLSQTPGDYAVTASFDGDATYQASSDGQTFTIERAVTMTSYGGPPSSEYYAPFTASATLVDPDGGAPVAGETVRFALGSTDGCSDVTDASGSASCSITPTQGAGSYRLVASFAGDDLYVARTNTEPFTIKPARTATTVTASPATASTFGQPVTFTAVVSTPDSPGAPHPRGSATFTVDTTPAGSGSLVAASASTATASLAAGSHTVTATYGGENNFLPSSGALSYTVTCAVNVNGTHAGALTVTTSTCLAGGAQVDGAVIVKPGGALDVEGASISGALDASGGAGVIRVCNSAVGGAIDVKHSNGLAMMGDPGDGCAANHAGGAFLVHSDTNGVEAVDNTAAGSILTSGDSGPGPYPGDATTISGNHAGSAGTRALGPPPLTRA